MCKLGSLAIITTSEMFIGCPLTNGDRMGEEPDEQEVAHGI